MSASKVRETACPVCGGMTIIHRRETQQFAYLDGSKDVLLTAIVPVEYCSACDETFVGEEGEMAQHDAVCNYLGRLTPTEIKQIRKRMKLTQRELSELTRIGIASIKRWEAGTIIQSEAMDNLLRNVGKNDTKRKAIASPPRFRTQLASSAFEAAKKFELRPRLAA